MKVIIINRLIVDKVKYNIMDHMFSHSQITYNLQRNKYGIFGYRDY